MSRSQAGIGAWPRRRAAVCALGLALGLTGCSAPYYAKLAWEQAKFLGRARPISEVIEASGDESERARLSLVLAARDFASRHGLDPGGSYLSVSDTTGLAVAYVVTAAHQDRLEPYLWRYPFVGRIPYRGYFERAAAERQAERLREQGLDTMVVHAAAYSTLGWFNDPLPSSLLERDRVTLVATVLHELAHQRLFVRDQIAFNETFANAVGLRLTVLFFEERGETRDAESAAARYRTWLARGRFFDALAAELRAGFERARADDGSSADLLSARSATYEAAQMRYLEGGLGEAVEGDFSQGPMDNARFLAIYRYAERTGSFDRYFTSFENMGEALAALEGRLEESDDPWSALAVQ